MGYVVKTRQDLDWWNDFPLDLTNTLHVDGPKLVDTRLVDKDGNPIYRTPPPIGFGRNDEW